MAGDQWKWSTLSTKPAEVLMLRTECMDYKSDRFFMDAALALIQRGKSVSVITLKNNLTVPGPKPKELKIYEVGVWIPKDFLGWFKQVFHFIKCVYAALYISIRYIKKKQTVVLVNSSEYVVPILRLIGRNVVICYKWYDPLEINHKLFKDTYANRFRRMCMRHANEVFVPCKNSANIFAKVYPGFGIEPTVCYPCIDQAHFKRIACFDLKLIAPKVPHEKYVFVALGKFNWTSNMHVVLLGFHLAMSTLRVCDQNKISLIIAGKYNYKCSLHRQYFSSLNKMRLSTYYPNQIHICALLSAEHKKSLMCNSLAIFHLVDNDVLCKTALEAMYLGKTIITTDCGIDQELLLPNVTGFAVTPNEYAVCEIITKLVENRIRSVYMGKLAEERFMKTFSFQNYRTHINKHIDKYMNC